MSDLEERLRGADRVSAPDLWDRIESKAREPGPRRFHRAVTIALALAVGAAGVGGVVAAFLGRSEPAGLPQNGVFVYADQGPPPPAIPFDNVDLFALDPATGERVNLTNTLTIAESSPVWSPDGAMVVYQRATAEGEGGDLRVRFDLVVADADGSDPRVIRACGADGCGVFDVAWSPDGTRLTWTTDLRVEGGFVGALEVYNLETGEATILCDSRSCGFPGQPAWSPDGALIAFSDAGSARIPGPFLPNGPIWLADPASGRVEPLTKQTGPCGPTAEECVFDSAPAWSPHGTSIAFVRTTSLGRPGATTEVVVVDVDGSNERILSECVSQDQCLRGPLAWSPEGSWMAFFERYRPAALTLVDPTTGQESQIPLPFDVGGYPYPLRWSPDGTELAFLGAPARVHNLYVVDVSTGQARQVAEDVASQGGLSWLPAGAIDLSTSPPSPVASSTPEPTIPVPTGTIVFASSNGSDQEDEGVEIWTVAADGSGLTQLTDNEHFDGGPAISPDGTRISFHSYRPGDRNTQIYVMNADGTGQRVLTDLRTGATSPAWSPDGTRIAFASSPGFGDPGGIFVMDADGSDLELVAEGNAFDPSWSPDGTRIVYALNTPDGHVGLTTVDLASGAVQALPSLPGEQHEPAWSPDGQTIGFEWVTRSGSGLYAMALDGSGLRRLADGAAPAWSPDGRWLAYTYFDEATGPQIWIVAADGTGARAITSMAGFIAGTGISAITGNPSWGAG